MRVRMSRIGMMFVLQICGLAALAEPTESLAAHPVYKTPDLEAATVADVSRVIDGDNVILSYEGADHRCLLIGVDAPRVTAIHGQQSAQFLENLLNGKKVFLVTEGGPFVRDKAGRAPVFLFRYPHGQFVNLEIVRQGYGRAFVKYPFEGMEAFTFYEGQAKAAKRGLWAPNADKPEFGGSRVYIPDTLMRNKSAPRQQPCPEQSPEPTDSDGFLTDLFRDALREEGRDPPPRAITQPESRAAEGA